MTTLPGAPFSITLNGQPRLVPPGTTVAQLVAELGLLPQRVAVEVNRQLAPRRDHATTPLHEGDVVEVLTFVGGG